MADTIQLDKESERSYQRLLPRLERELSISISSDPRGWQEFNSRLKLHFQTLFQLYLGIYGGRYDFFFHLEDLLLSLARSWFARPQDLRALDQAREADPLWFQSNQMLGGVCYVDLFAGGLEGIKSKIPYF
jgi:hypothetical protein